MKAINSYGGTRLSLSHERLGRGRKRVCILYALEGRRWAVAFHYSHTLYGRVMMTIYVILLLSSKPRRKENMCNPTMVAGEKSEEPGNS